METFLTILWLSLTAVDIGTTEYAMHKYPANIQEGNPIVMRRDVRYTINIAPAVGYFLSRNKMSKKEKYIVLGSLSMFRATIVTNNLIQIKRADAYQRVERQAQRWGNSYPWQRLEFAQGY